MRIESVILY